MFTWSVVERPGAIAEESVVTITFADLGGGKTEMTFHQAGLATEAERALAGQPAATSSPLSPPSVSGPTRRTDAPSSASGFWRTSLAAASRIWG